MLIGVTQHQSWEDAIQKALELFAFRRKKARVYAELYWSPVAGPHYVWFVSAFAHECPT